jgi:hypothetical protein
MSSLNRIEQTQIQQHREDSQPTAVIIVLPKSAMSKVWEAHKGKIIFATLVFTTAAVITGAHFAMDPDTFRQFLAAAMIVIGVLIGLGSAFMLALAMARSQREQRAGDAIEMTNRAMAIVLQATAAAQQARPAP